MKKRGFTLIELLIVISIIGVLAAMVTANFAGVRARARDSRRKAEFDAVKKALRIYYNDFQGYPADSGGQIAGCGDGTEVCAWGTATFEANGTQYMGRLPKDPLNKDVYVYTYTVEPGADNFSLTTHLENTSDADSADSQTRCGVAAQDVVVGEYRVCAD